MPFKYSFQDLKVLPDSKKRRHRITSNRPGEIEGFSCCLIQSVQLSRIKDEQTQAHHAGNCRNAA